MAAQALTSVAALVVLSLFSAAFTEDVPFPKPDEFDFIYYSTEVQVTSVNQDAAVYATEYYDTEDDRGALKLYFQGDLQSIYFDNSTFEVTEVSGTNCTTKDEDLSDYVYTSIYYGWLNRDPLVIGPSAALWFAQSQRDNIKYAGQEAARDIMCDKYTLEINNKLDKLKYDYYFATKDWTTPYTFKKLRVPVRIRVSGKSSRFSASEDKFAEVDQISDFAFFKPSIDDFNNLLPPTGLGCKSRKEADDMPPVPKVFQYSAEVVDLLEAAKKDDVEIQFQTTWFDSLHKLARRDKYSRKKGGKSNLYDFNTGTYYTVNQGVCQMKTLRDTEFQVFDYGMTSRMMEPKEALNLDGSFYSMGKRDIRGLRCDTYESVEFDAYYNDKIYYKLVVTAYFTEAATNVGVNGETESRIPVYYIITGYSAPDNVTLQLQYNIFAFDDVIWPEMYTSYNLEQCFRKAESKAYFVLIMEVPTDVATQMEGYDEVIMRSLRGAIAKKAKVPEMRIPYLKADYKSNGVYVTGVMLERPEESLQFFKFDSGPTVTNDPDLKVIVEAATVDQCSAACIDEGDFLCKGFYFCGKACFLKSTDPFDTNDPDQSKTLGDCTEYLRGVIDSTNFRQVYLDDALGNLETAVLNKTLSVAFPIKDGEEVVTISDIMIGDGPYTGAEGIEKPYVVSVPLRKLDTSMETIRSMQYVGSIHDCYKACKEAGAECSSFSYCPDSANDNKECMISSELVINGITKDTDLVADKNCNIYNLKFVDYFDPYPGRLSILKGDKVINSVDAIEKCAQNCRLEADFKCRGFEFCREKKVCTLHSKHILELKSGEMVKSDSNQCVHYAARFIVDYVDMGRVLIEDSSNTRYAIALEECAKICSEDLKENCKSFNYCPGDSMYSDSTCELSTKLLRDDGITTTEKKGCRHHEKREVVHDWDKSKVKLSTSGYTKKGFTGLAVGMLFLGVVLGALGFVLYSYIRSRSSGEGMAVRFMKNET